MIAHKISQIRAKLGLTQTMLAQRLGVSFPTVNRWENGKSQPYGLFLESLRNLAREAGVEIENPKPRLRLSRRKK